MLYGVHFQMQQPEIEAHCFGDCGGIILGAITLGDLGDLLPCRTEDCPHLEKQVLLDGCDVQGEPITLRKLRKRGA